MARSRTQIAFLLTQLGTSAAEQFGARVAQIDLTRPESGLLRMIGREPGQSQRTLADRLGTPPSRLVALVDGLEARGLVERRRNETDRRNYELVLTTSGEAMMRRLTEISTEHESAVTSALTAAERTELDRLLRKLADAHGLVPGVHPGYRTLPR